ncbi:MAG: hypothetical protein JWP11_1235 [Frankiales bacterium]|nr:hypothetical protein [Frankiales bacterium]
MRPASLPMESLQELVARASSLSDRLAGMASRALGELQVRGGGSVPDPAVSGAACPTPAWLRSVAKVTGTGAGLQVRTSMALRELPAVVDAVVDGTITQQHGRVLTRLVGKIEPAALRRSQPQLIEVARRTDPDQLGQYVSHLLATWCEPALDAEEASAEDRRFLQLRDTHRGSVRGSFEIPDADAEVLRTVLASLARRDGSEDTRSARQRNADVLTDVFGVALRHADLPGTGGSRPRLTYVIPVAWALRLPSAAARATGHNAGHLGNTTDPTAAFAIDLERHPGADCASAPGPVRRPARGSRRCCVTPRSSGSCSTSPVRSSAWPRSPTRSPLLSVVPSPAATAKGCSRPPAFCDVHHLRARADGGPTTIDNLVLLCRRHHVMWHRQLLDLTDLRTPWIQLPQPRVPAHD